MTPNRSAAWPATLGFVLAVAALVVLSITVVFSYLSIGFGIAGTGGIIPIAWIVAAGLNALPFLLAVAGTAFGVVGRDRGIGIAAIVVGAVGIVSAGVAIALCLAIGLANPPT